MIVEFQYESPLLRTALQEAAIGEVAIEQLDTASSVPLRTVCWLEGDRVSTFEAGLETDRTVERAMHVVDTGQGHQYTVKHSGQYPGVEMYSTAVEEDAVFISGTRCPDHWEVQMRFPDRDAFEAFQRQIETVDLSVKSIHHSEPALRANDYDISEPQREILLLAIEQGYFRVPRQASLADLADTLDVSSQAASERLRRGLDSLVERTLLTPE